MEDKTESKMALDSFFAGGGTVEDFLSKVRPMDEFLADIGEDTADTMVRQRTHYGCALRVVDADTGRIGYDDRVGVWVAYDAALGVWVRNAYTKVFGIVQEFLFHQVSRELKDLNRLSSAEETGKHKKLLVELQNARYIDGVLKSLAPMLPFDVQTLDANPHLLVVANGTLHFESDGVVLRDHDPSDKASVAVPVRYQSDATSPTWESYLNTFHPDVELRDYLQRVTGAALAGGGPANKLAAIMLGPSNTGKSTFRDGMRAALGPDLVWDITAGTITKGQRRGNAPDPDLMALVGKRLVFCMELSEVDMDAERIKQWSGGEPITARQLHQGIVSFPVTFTLFLGTNNDPNVQDDSDALWSRLKTVPFKTQVSPDARITGDVIKQRLSNEAEGILAWIVRGYLDYTKGGLREPDAVRKASTELRDRSDVVREFIAECMVEAEGTFVTWKSLQAAYQSWALDQGVVMSRGELKSLKDHFSRLFRSPYERLPTTGRPMGWQGHGLLSESEGSDKNDVFGSPSVRLPQEVVPPPRENHKTDVEKRQKCQTGAWQPPTETWTRPKLSFSFVDEAQPHNNTTS